MGKWLILITLLTALASKTLVRGIQVSPSDCSFTGYLDNKIYCYVSITSLTASSHLYTLDIVQFLGQQTDSLRTKWEPVEPSTSFDPEQRRVTNAIVLSDNKRLLVQGGYGAVKFTNQTVFYDTTSNSWQNALPYSEVNRGIRQIYGYAVVNLPNNLVGFYGGSEQFVNNSAPQITITGESMPFFSEAASWVGFTNLQMYSPEAKSWAPFDPQLNRPANFYTNSQSAILDENTGKVYFLGGEYHTPSVSGVSIGFMWCHSFDTKSGNWFNETFKGDIPNNRVEYTVNLIPNSQDVIIYGGTDSNYTQPISDYCFTLNLKNNVWTKHSKLNIPSGLSGPRFSHLSVMLNTTLLILFGRTQSFNNTEQLPFLALDVSDAANISYMDIFNITALPKADESNNVRNSTNLPGSTSPLDPPPSSLSKGAIGGIAAGIVVAVLAVALVIFFCVRNRRKLKQNKAQEDEYYTEQLDVDWDKIDEHYMEVPHAKPNDSNSPHLKNSMDATTRESLSLMDASTLQTHNTPNLENMNIKEDDELSSYQQQEQKPNTADVNVLRPSIEVDIVRPSIEVGIVKPSIDVGTVKPSIDINDKDHTVVKPDAV